METYRGGSTNQGLRRLLRKYAEGGPVMRSYEPSWRDRIGAYLFDQTSGSPVSRRTVEGLVGSTGLGNTGLSIADVVPGGQALAAQEALREGDYKGAAMAVMPIPGASKLGPLARSAAPIRAYHSSPHDFDKFDLSKIGTGEGAQAYGHGLYMAENPAVSGRGGEYDKQFTQRMRAGADRSLAQYGGDVDAAEAAARAEIERLNDLPNKGGDPDRLARLIETQQDRLAALNTFKQTGEFPKSRIYEVNIKADPEHLMDWDKPLNKQSKYVQDAVENAANKIDIDPFEHLGLAAVRKEHPRSQTYSPTGNDIYNDLEEILGKKEAATNALKGAGIPGIKYLDEGSRGQKYWVARHPQGGAVEFPNETDTLAYIKRNPEYSLERPNISSNYVVFDDKIIEIAKKYGIPLAAASAIFEASNPRPAMASEAPVDRARGGAVQGYATGGPTDNSLEALYRKYAEPTMRQRTRARYAEGGPVSSAAIYDPAEIDALAASIIEGNYA